MTGRPNLASNRRLTIISNKNIQSFDEFLRRIYKRTTKHFLDDSMDLDESLNAAVEETSDEVLEDVENEIIEQMRKIIFGK
jgi:hypothetical protein